MSYQRETKKKGNSEAVQQNTVALCMICNYKNLHITKQVITKVNISIVFNILDLFFDSKLACSCFDNTLVCIAGTEIGFDF